MRTTIPMYMGFQSRRTLYSKIEEIRGRPLIAYMLSNRSGIGGMMALDVIPEICEQLNMIPESEEAVDVIMVGMGGDPTLAWRLMSILRERFDRIGVLLPFQAQSAATVLAFGADEIIMHPFSCLGPIDPQIRAQVQRNIDNRNMVEDIAFSVEDVKSYIDFIREDLHLTDSQSSNDALKYLCEELRPTLIGIVKKSMKFSESLASNLLKQHMDEDKIEGIVKQFNNFSNHGYTVSRREAISFGLPVIDSPDGLDALLWGVWKDAEEEMQCREPFDPLTTINESNEVRNLFSSKNETSVIKTITDESKIALVESTDMASSFIIQTIIRVQRNKLNIDYNVIVVPKGWNNKE